MKVVGSWVMVSDKQVAIVVRDLRDGSYLVHPVNEKGETVMRFSESLNRLVTDERQVDGSVLREAKAEEIPVSRRLREVK